MATVTGLTADRMLAIEDASIVAGALDGSGHLILTTHGGTDIDAGSALVAVPNASTTVVGAVELATTAETSALTDATRAITPASLATLANSKSDTSHTHAFSAITGTATNAQLATMVNNTVKGNVSGSTASPSDLTVSDLHTLLFGGWTTWASMTLKGDTTDPTMGTSALTGQYRIYNNMFDMDASLVIGTGWANGSGHYYLTIPSSRVAADYKLGCGQGAILGAPGTANPSTVVFKVTNTGRIYLANETFWWGSQWTVSAGDAVRWSIRGLRLA